MSAGPALLRRTRSALAGGGTGRGGDFTRKVMVLSGATLLGQGVVVASTPLLTRLYTPEEFGVMAAFVSLLLILLPVSSLRYELAIPLAEDDRSAASLLALACAAVVATSAVIGAAVLLFPAPIAAAMGDPAVAPFLWLLPLALLGAGTYQALNYWAIRHGRFKSIALTRLTQSVGQVAAQLAGGLLNLGVFGLVGGDAVGRIGGTGTLGTLALRRDGEALRAVTAARMGEVARRFRRFPLISSGSALLNSVGLNAPALLLAAMYGPATAGLFVLAQRVIGMPMRLLGNAVAQVYLSEAGRLVHQDPDGVRRLFVRTGRRLLLAGVAPTLLIALVGGVLFRGVFGAEWHQAGVYAQVLALAFAAQTVMDPLSQTLNVLHRQDLQLAWDAVRVTAVVAAIAGAAQAGRSATVAVALYGGVMVLSYGLLFALCLHAFRAPRRAG